MLTRLLYMCQKCEKVLYEVLELLQLSFPKEIASMLLETLFDKGAIGRLYTTAWYLSILTGETRQTYRTISYLSEIKVPAQLIYKCVGDHWGYF